MRSRLYILFALRIQLPSANEKFRIFSCVQRTSRATAVGYKLSRVALRLQNSRFFPQNQ